MIRKFSLTPEANNDLAEILADVAEDSPDAADRLHSELYEAFRLLAQSPGVGHYHDELLDRRFRFWNFYSYVVCYAWSVEPIQIIAVVHGARDLAVFFDLRTSDHGVQD